MPGGGGAAGEVHQPAGAAPLEFDDPAQRVGGGGGLEFEGAPGLAGGGGGADLHEAGVRALAEVCPLVRGGVEGLHHEAHVHPVVRVPVGGHRAANADRVGVSGGVAQVHGGPQFRRLRQRPKRRWAAAGAEDEAASSAPA